jgi:Cof subfamily protein (haloacid dehalogenase superfamily)
LAVVLDVDGTLALPDHRVSPRALAALRGLQTVGVLPIVVTGRGEAEALRICRDAGITAPTISCNGALTTDPVTGRRLRQVSVEPQMLAAAAAFAERHGVQLLLWTPDGVHAEYASEATRLLTEINQEAVIISPLAELAATEVVKVMITASPEVLDRVVPAARRETPFLERSMGWFLEATHPDATKWQSLHRALAGLGIAPADCAGIADGDNDLEWLSQVGVAIAVANARPDVLKMAANTIGPNSTDSVAALLEEWTAGVVG